MLIKLFTAGYGDYKKVLKRRCVLFGLLIFLGLSTIAASVILGFLEVLQHDFVLGFYAGAGAGVAGFSTVGLVGTLRLMRDETRMRAEQIKETDERKREISLRAASTTALILISAVYVALMVSAVLNLAVFFTLLAVVAVFFAVFLSSVAYYNKKL